MDSTTLYKQRLEAIYTQSERGYQELMQDYRWEDILFSAGYYPHYIETEAGSDLNSHLHRFGKLEAKVCLGPTWTNRGVVYETRLQTYIDDINKTLNGLKQEVIPSALKPMEEYIDFLTHVQGGYEHHQLKGRPLLWQSYQGEPGLASIIRRKQIEDALLNEFLSYYSEHRVNQEEFMTRPKLNTLMAKAYTFLSTMYTVRGESLPYSLTLGYKYKPTTKMSTVKKPEVPKDSALTMSFEDIPKELWAYAYYFVLILNGPYERITQTVFTNEAERAKNAEDTAYSSELINKMVSEITEGYSEETFNEVWQHRDDRNDVFRMYIVGYYGIQKLASKYNVN